MKKLILCLAMALAVNTTAFGASSNNITKVQHLRNGQSLANAEFEITPHSEVETGSSIIITFTNATVFSQSIIDGTSTDTKETGYKAGGWQYNENGVTWNGSDSFAEVVPKTASGQLPYRIRRINDIQIEVYLMTLPDLYVGDSLKAVNGSSRTPYYSIPMVAYADSDTDSNVTVSIDSNGTSISDTLGNTLNNSLATSESTTVTESTTETTTAENNTENTDTLTNKVAVTIGSNTITVNSKSVTIDAPAYIQKESSSALIPLRAVSQGVVGNEDCVSWDAENKTAIITVKGTEIRFTAGSNMAYINGKYVTMDNGVKAEITDSRMFVPFRALGQALGAEVSWDGTNKTAYFN